MKYLLLISLVFILLIGCQNAGTNNIPGSPPSDTGIIKYNADLTDTIQLPYQVTKGFQDSAADFRIIKMLPGVRASYDFKDSVLTIYPDTPTWHRN